ncbi:carboxyl-terminal processing protease [Daejeonella rubra]|uniref:Carboxyl-terminal processing protease n=2 Tax=Daejeonella rubra TaxID=990371 RepID=A0A1G9NQP8_9SPHI|nr:carboxyl-terminal processing protease [Daejeonella rubra]
MKSGTKKNILIAAGYSVVLIAGLILGPKLVRENQNSKNGSFLPFGLSNRSAKVEQVIQIINENYVDSVKLDTIQDIAIQEILKQLDPHSAYLAPEEAQLMSDDLEGNFNGIGIEYYILNDTLLVTSVNPGGPAFKAGLRHGDKILAINKKAVSGIRITSRKVVEQIRGKKGSSVELLVKRDTVNRNFSVLRDRIVVSSIDADYMLGDQTGYVKISKFGAQTDEDFHASVLKLKKQGMKNLILDLRDNGGGYLNSATALADEFLKDKALIVYTEGLHEPRTDYFASSKGEFEDGKLVVLIDENTASASEIVAGAIQDLERGTIIGRRSFGKGLVQEQFDFGDGSALNLTIARYYTASGRSIQKSYKNGNQAYYKEVNDRLKNGELSSDGKGLSDSLFNKNKSYTTKSGKLVYGGGGIMPDIFIPVDTSGYTELYSTLTVKGVLNEMLYNHLVRNNQKFNSAEEIIRSFVLSDQDIKKIIQIAAAKKIKANAGQLQTSRNEIETQLKALFARYHFGDEGYYKALNSGDQAISRSLEVFKVSSL